MVVATLVMGALVGGLSGTAAAASPAATFTTDVGGLSGTSWLLHSMSGGGTSTPVPSGIGASLEFVGDAAGGYAGCNHFTSSYTNADGLLTFGPIATTRMACDDASMSFETSYLTALSTVARYMDVDGTLTLLDTSGGAALTFEGPRVTSLEGPWIVTGYHDGSAVASPRPDSYLTVSFSPDGHVEGNDGCNDFGGGYSTDGTHIAIGPLMSTMRSCEDARDAQEQRFLAALEAATTWEVTSGTLRLRDAAGVSQVEAVTAIGR